MKTIGAGLATILAIAVSLLLLAGIILGGWQLGWWFKTQNTNRESHLYEHEYGHQSSLITEIGDKQAIVAEITVQLGYKGADVTALNAQRLGVANVICRDAAQLNGDYDGLSADQREFVTANCDGATVSVTSNLRP